LFAAVPERGAKWFFHYNLPGGGIIEKNGP